MRNSFPRASQSVRDSLCSHFWEFNNQSKLHNCQMYREGLNWSYAGSLVAGSDSVGSYDKNYLFLLDFMWNPRPIWLLFSFLTLFRRIPQAQDNVWLWVSAFVSLSYWMNVLWWQLKWFPIWSHKRARSGYVSNNVRSLNCAILVDSWKFPLYQVST